MDVGRIAALLDESAKLHEQIKELAPEIEDAASICAGALRTGHKIILFGNGGSAADAQHLACEMVVKYGFERPSIPAIALTTNTSILTASANDLGFETVFARQVEALANEGDVVFAISTSGSSPNVLAAADAARGKSCVLVALTGANGHELAERCDHALMVPHTQAARIQEAHITIGHVICDLVEAELYGGPGA